MTATLTDPPIRTSLLLALTTQGALLNELFAALSSSSSDIPALHASLVQSSAQLDSLAADAEEHQRAWAALLAQKREVEGLEMRVRGLLRELEGGRVELETLVDEGRRVSKSIALSEDDPVDVPVLLAHAHALARTTSAPVSSLLAPVDRAHATPWPNETQMRQGLLWQLGGSMSGMGDVGAIGEDREEEKQGERVEVVHEEQLRRYNPEAVFKLDFNSDDSDDE
ncbi:hypothetical protein CspeluHIS016_0309690 [Cutaneotrichosporon spelunceum]|uniref:Mediator of RNA polymerase II transcription subunit 4 n=1 Tax=Cutaneotrichosporon spelunceum TaxID=1672016 RepID=A0AAD3YCR2_9TREE|nr:hypothetical protein CspeluHIS016_0309690 [Cutaneotrichosporon spelunceum]